MDWKDLLASKVASGELQREDSTPIEKTVEIKGRPTLHIEIDRKGRKGKSATIIYGFDPDGKDDAEVEELSRKLKQRLATGGSARCGEILIQGERLPEVKKVLLEMGYKVK